MSEQPSLSNINALVIDMDGVLWRGETAMPGFAAFFGFLRRQNISFTLATNNARKTPAQYVRRFAGLDVEISAGEVLTSSLATAEYLKTRYPPGSSFFVIGQDGLHQAIIEAGFAVAETEAQAVVVGLDFELTYNKLKTATLLINSGAGFIGTNPDLTFPIEGGVSPGCGAILALLAAATGQQPVIIGKPAPMMFDLAVQRMGMEPARTAMLGDRLETDILGGQQAGLKTILVLSGVTSAEMLAAAAVQPDWVFADIGALLAAWQKAAEKT